jgi:hypothetical protein
MFINYFTKFILFIFIYFSYFSRTFVTKSTPARVLAKPANIKEAALPAHFTQTECGLYIDRGKNKI